MSWSLGEIRALSVKATRGAGMDWGIAEEAGFAVEWLESHGLQGAEALAQYLSTLDAQENFEATHCPLKLGCLISDTGDWSTLNEIKLIEPLLVVPFIASTVENKTVLLRWGDSEIFIQKNCVATNDKSALISALGTGYHTIEIALSECTQEFLKPKTRVLEDSKQYIATLTEYAHKTYAPATEASRLAGAGAGLNDND